MLSSCFFMGISIFLFFLIGLGVGLGVGLEVWGLRDRVEGLGLC